MIRQREREERRKNKGGNIDKSEDSNDWEREVKERGKLEQEKYQNGGNERTKNGKRIIK